MLFSHSSVSNLVRSRFVAAWQSVRPVPHVTIDFGDGHKLERTLNGNVVTWICDPQGRVIDAIPGLCDAETYVRRLGEALALYEHSKPDFERTVLAYHRARTRPPPPPDSLPDRGKSVGEFPLKSVLGVEDDLLQRDAEFNGKEREPRTHRLLSDCIVRPADMTARLYREVLHVDLDDPWLGLASGPFDGGAYGGKGVE